jgi:cell division septation protein DedD
MAGKRNGGGGREMVLESRHVIGLFLVIVVVSGVVFTLGYILGRNQYETQVRAAGLNPKETARASADAAPATKSAPAGAKTPPAAPAASDWDFYKSAESKQPENRLEKAVKTTASPPNGKPAATKGSAAAQPTAASTADPGKAKSLLNAPLIPRGAIVLQVAALTQEGDALALAGDLQKKKFPAYVLTPSGDPYYRVQVGPYADQQSANLARKGLEREGFKAIQKR